MKKQDIRSEYTKKVAELLGKGYTIYPDTMNGSQGEIAHIDLTNGNEIIRVLLERGLCWSRIGDGFTGNMITMTVGRADASTWVEDGWSGTIWNNRLEPIYKREWAEISEQGEGWYTDPEEAAEIGRIRRERYMRSRENGRETLGNEYKEIAIRWLRKQPRMKTARMADIEKVERYRTGEKRRFEITAKGQRFAIR